MASKKQKDAKKKRKSAERKRAAAQRIINDPNKSAAQKAAARQRRDANAATMREQGNIMRAETGREKGQRTTYTGPIGVEARTDRGLPAETDWQKVNLRWLQDIQAANPNWTITQARNELKRMFADDRPGYLAEQQRRIDAGETADFPVSDVATVDSPVGGTGRGGPGLLGPFSPGGRMPAGYGGPLGGYGGGAAAQDAAQGWAGEMGFNISPRGGLLLRPWEAASWQLAGIDPRLWNPQSGLIGGPSQYTQPGFGQVGAGVGGTGVTPGVNIPGATATTGTTTDTTTGTPGKTHWEIMADHYDLMNIPHINGFKINEATNTTPWTDPNAAAPLVVNRPGEQIRSLQQQQANRVRDTFVNPSVHAETQAAALAQAQALANQQANQQLQYQQAAFGLLPDPSGYSGTPPWAALNTNVVGPQ